jgi:hypothetical protein
MIDLNQLGLSGFPIESIVMLAFYFVLGAYAIFSAIFYYHWKSYGFDIKVTSLTLIIYLATTAPVLLIMTIAALNL